MNHQHSDSDDFMSTIMPQAELTIASFGHALAYQAAARSGNIPQPLMDIYLCGVMRLDSAWYVENGIGREKQIRRETRALQAAMPHLQEYLSSLRISQYVQATIADQEWLKKEHHDLPAYGQSEMLAKL